MLDSPDRETGVDVSIGTWIRATRPQFLTITAVAVGVAVAGIAYEGMRIDWTAAVLCLLGALCVHGGANMVNDFHDREGDAGNVERLTPFTGGSRMIQDAILTPRATALAGYALVAASGLIGMALIAMGRLQLLWVGMLGIAMAIAYSAPPLRFSARGWGEFVVAGAWLLVVIGTDLVLREECSLQPVVAGLPLACLVAAILWVNEYPDERADRRSGKRTLVVVLGLARAARWHLVLVTGAYAWLAGAMIAGRLPLSATLGLIGLPWSCFAAVRLIQAAGAGGDSQRFRPVIGATIAAAHLHGVGLIIGLTLG